MQYSKNAIKNSFVSQVWPVFNILDISHYTSQSVILNFKFSPATFTAKYDYSIVFCCKSCFQPDSTIYTHLQWLKT